METTLHRCTETCVCPAHGTALLYAPATSDHACQDTGCEHAHGGLGPAAVLLARLARMRPARPAGGPGTQVPGSWSWSMS